MNNFDVIIIGGSYAGLSAALALGRAERQVLVIDSGKPCNRFTPHSHNFISHDGKVPADITAMAKADVLKYKTVKFKNDVAEKCEQWKGGFTVSTGGGEMFNCRKLIFASGIIDQMPNIVGFADCWGKTAIHCPYCHGYEVRHKKTGILGNGDYAFDFARLIRNWTKDLSVFTNGPCTLTTEQSEKIKAAGIDIVEKVISRIEHENGTIKQLVFNDGSETPLNALYSKLPFVQQCRLPAVLGCEFTETGHIKTDMFQRSTVQGVFACGDNSHPMRSVSVAAAAGTMAGAMLNKEMSEEEFDGF